VELLSLLSIGVDQTEPRESENDGESESSDSEHDEDQSNEDDDDGGDVESIDYEDDEVSFTALSSRNPFELLTDDS